MRSDTAADDANCGIDRWTNAHSHSKNQLMSAFDSIVTSFRPACYTGCAQLACVSVPRKLPVDSTSCRPIRFHGMDKPYMTSIECTVAEVCLEHAYHNGSALSWLVLTRPCAVFTRLFPLLNPIKGTERQSCTLEEDAFIAVLAFLLLALVKLIVSGVARTSLVGRRKPHIILDGLDIVDS